MSIDNARHLAYCYSYQSVILHDILKDLYMESKRIYDDEEKGDN